MPKKPRLNLFWQVYQKEDQPPVLYMRQAFKGRQYDWSKVNWSEPTLNGARRHALISSDPRAAYKFPSFNLHASNQEEQISNEIMDLGREVRNLIKQGREESAMKVLKIIFRDFNAASLVNYRACQQHVGKPTLTAHQDDENVHACDFIASISFGRDARFKWGTSSNDPHMNSIILSDGDLVCFDRMA